uniref:Uncharacterized protein n=1 Tax=Arundo donax TaxID=35708 RepID=A0A0A9CGS8_ARUDO
MPVTLPLFSFCSAQRRLFLPPLAFLSYEASMRCLCRRGLPRNIPWRLTLFLVICDAVSDQRVLFALVEI